MIKRAGNLVRYALDTLAVAIVVCALAFGVRLGVKQLLQQSPSMRDLSQHEFLKLAYSGHWLGPEEATVVVLVYNDYACGFCQELHETLRTIRRRYPEHLAVAIKPFLTDASHPAFRVALGAECAAEQQSFAAYHEAAFAKKSVLRYTDGWKLIGESVNLSNTELFNECVRTHRYAESIEEDARIGERLGVDGTPTLFINGRRVVGAPPLVQLDSLIARELPGRGPP